MHVKNQPLPICLLSFVFCFTAIQTFGQTETNLSASKTADHGIQITLPQVSLIAVRSNGNNTISLAPIFNTEGGSMTNTFKAVDSSLWLNYTHVNAKNRLMSRSVYVRLGSGFIPQGFKLTVKAGNSVQLGSLAQGVPLGEVELTSVDSKLIGDIQTTYTGFGVGKGHRLIYKLSVKPEEVSSIDYDATSYVQVLYTIAD